VSFFTRFFPKQETTLSDREAIPIAHAPAAGTITCAGRVVACDRLLTSPVAASLVWYECIVEVFEAALDGSEQEQRAPTPVLVLSEASPFEIEDGSGERLRVVPLRGTLLPDVMAAPRVRADGGFRARLFDLLVQHNKAVDTRSELFFSQSAVALGDRIVVRGAVTRASEAPYRSGPERPTLSADGAELVVSKRDVV
jgi:hypothetical protein